MKKIFKYLIIKSYTKDYHTVKLDEIQTIWMKESVHNEFVGSIKYMRSLIWLSFYTFIIDFFINSLLIMLIVIFMISIMLMTLSLWTILNTFQIYY